MIHTNTLDGWGGCAILEDDRLAATYAAGIFETTQLVGALLSGLVGFFAVGVAFVMPNPVLAWTCVASAVCMLISGSTSWWTAFRSLRASGARVICLSRRTIAVDDERRFLAGAVVEVEANRLFSRLSLSWPDGRRVPLLQGPTADVECFRQALCG